MIFTVTSDDHCKFTLIKLMRWPMPQCLIYWCKSFHTFFLLYNREITRILICTNTGFF